MIDFCINCENKNEIELNERLTKCIIKNESIEFMEKYYSCPNCGEEFYTSEIIEENLLKAKDEYRKKHNLLTSKEIKDIRNKYNLSQSDLSLILGWGEVTITRYESKEIQNEKYDEVLRYINDNPYGLYDYFKLNSNSFDQKKQMKITKKIFNVAPNKELNNKLLEETLIKKHFSIEDINRGNQTISLHKIIAVIGELVDAGIELYKTKLSKLLWYIDMLNFKKYKKGITGLAYFHMDYGACPLGLDILLDSNDIQVKQIEEEDSVKNIIVSVNCVYKLSIEEQEIIRFVTDKFKDFSTAEIVDYMHQEKGYIETKNYDFISYDYAKNINI